MEPIPQPDLTELHQLTHNPFTGTHIIWDVSTAIVQNEEQVNSLLSIGFEPYAVTMEPNTNQDVMAKAKLTGQIAIVQKQWFKRPRAVNLPPEFTKETL